jgi:tetratricopeptide (TPR) repeat protein
LTFLSHATSVAQGEEFCAIARLEKDQALPVSVTVRGTVDGQPFLRVVPVADVRSGAGYLPRTWARLEIDRLLAQGAGKNRDAIVALSKAMYVMTPFTSLLVLENEAMYQQYKVDRGRKDHWAMYPCPETIPVVYEPPDQQPGGEIVVIDGSLSMKETDLRDSDIGFYPPNQALVVKSTSRIYSWKERDLTNVDIGIDSSLPTNYNVDRIEEISVPGPVDPNTPIGVANAPPDAGLQTVAASRNGAVSQDDYRGVLLSGVRSGSQGPSSGAGAGVPMPPGKRAFSVKAGGSGLAGGFVLPGNHVDVILDTRRGPDDLLGPPILEDVVVLWADTKATRDPDQPSPPEEYQLAITPAEAQRLSVAASQGELRLILRPFDKPGRVENALAILVPPCDTVFPRDNASVAMWNRRVRDAAEKHLARGEYLAVIALLDAYGDLASPLLTQDLLDLAVKGAAETPQRVRVTLAAISFLARREEVKRAQRLLDGLLADAKASRQGIVWRVGAVLAEMAKQHDTALGRLNRALEIDYDRMPERVDLKTIRRDYAQVLAGYEKRALDFLERNRLLPADFAQQVVRLADRWRSLDGDGAAACRAAERILWLVGERQLAWEYQTAALEEEGDAARWLEVARSKSQEGAREQADQVFATAFALQPANARILWERALNLSQPAPTPAARQLFRQLAEGTWAADYQDLQIRARARMK